MSLECRTWLLNGKVQGVGFRPFVYCLAHEFQLQGWVRNNVGRVEIQAQGKAVRLDAFHAALTQRSPTISSPYILACEQSEPQLFEGFTILSSGTSEQVDIHIPPDYATCTACLTEMKDESERRYQYPFINCTQCGPRYTLIRSLPYDRGATSMNNFPLCDDCLKEYKNPLDRRFHAEPLACGECGPTLQYSSPSDNLSDSDSALQAGIRDLRQGKIVAVKGVGGYHLMCDASNDLAVYTLRQRKRRPDKPLALLFPVRGDDGLEAVREVAELTEQEAQLLRSPARPIVLLQKKTNQLSALIAPKLNELGVMLAYSPLHHLLLDQIGKPLVATSANFTGEPVLIDQDDMESRLGYITQYFLHHNREILRPADDSVYRLIADKLRPLRLGRGYSPIEMDLPFVLDEPMVACGAHMKNTVALAWGNRLVISPHIGDLDSPRSMAVFEQAIDDLQRLYQVKATRVVCDAHPQYASSRWAESQGLPVTRVQHHKAHASAVMLEHWSTAPSLVFTWDGTGFGEDGTVWGGEAFYGKPGRWQRVASMRPFHLPGGDKVAREPWRSATALYWEESREWADTPVDQPLLKQAWQQGINAPQTSSVGRLFDAASAMTKIKQLVSFEGQGAMLLEQHCDDLYEVESLPLKRDKHGVWVANWALLLDKMTHTKHSIEARATLFHSMMAHTLLSQVEAARQQYTFTQVGLSGGVFQNKKLSDYVMTQLQLRGYQACMAETLPVNDAGISAGQIVEAAMGLT